MFTCLLVRIGWFYSVVFGMIVPSPSKYMPLLYYAAREGGPKMFDLLLDGLLHFSNVILDEEKKTGKDDSFLGKYLNFLNSGHPIVTVWGDFWGLSFDSNTQYSSQENIDSCFKSIEKMMKIPNYKGLNQAKRRNYLAHFIRDGYWRMIKLILKYFDNSGVTISSINKDLDENSDVPLLIQILAYEKHLSKENVQTYFDISIRCNEYVDKDVLLKASDLCTQHDVLKGYKSMIDDYLHKYHK